MFLGGIVLALAVGCGIFYLYFVAPRIVVRTTTPNGLELYVTQTWGELFSYNTSIRYRKPDGVGGGFYYDHEDTRWRRGRVALDLESKLATVFREGKPVILFDWEAEACSVKSGNLRTSKTQRQTGWNPPFWNPFSR